MSIRLTIDVKRIRRVLGRDAWQPPRPFGDDSWLFDRSDRTGRIIVSLVMYADRGGRQHDWLHASMSYVDRLPEYADLKLLHQAVFGPLPAYQVFVGPAEHYNHHEFCLHLWGRADGTPQLPDFAFAGGV